MRAGSETGRGKKEKKHNPFFVIIPATNSLNSPKSFFFHLKTHFPQPHCAGRGFDQSFFPSKDGSPATQILHRKNVYPEFTAHRSHHGSWDIRYHSLKPLRLKIELLEYKSPLPHPPLWRGGGGWGGEEGGNAFVAPPPFIEQASEHR